MIDLAGLDNAPAMLLIAAVGAIGVLHTMVPDHWAPIALIARQRGWSRGETARAAAFAGLGHTLSTLAIGAVVWLAGVVVAERFGHWVETISAVALIGFGGWIAVSAWLELRRHERQHAHGLVHAHDHPPLPAKTSGRTALLLILGSSPMVEGIPAFFAAGKFGAEVVVPMAVVFAISTIVTYVVLCVASAAGLQRLRFGTLERYGEVLSGAFIALVGVAFWLWPLI
jgi:hypothetical protein